MPPGGRSDQWRRHPRRREGQHQLELFLNRSRNGGLEQKVVDFIRWLEDSSDVKIYMWMVNLLQLWVPIVGGDANDETILSASEQPFGVGRLSNGICRYRYDSILCGRKTCPGDDGGDVISTAFATSSPRFEHHHRRQYGIQTRWALPLVDPTTGVRIGVLELVTINEYRCECQGMFTQCFLNFGPKYYERFCILGRGKSVESGQYSSHPHLLPQEDMIFGNDNLWCSTMYDVSNGLLGNANEDHANSANGFAAQFPTQQNTGRMINFEIGETSGTNLSDGNAVDYYQIDQITSFVDPVPTQENAGGTKDQSDEMSESFVDQYFGSYPVPTLENIDGTNDQIHRISNPVDDPITSPPATCRRKGRPSLDQLQRFFGRPLKEVATIFGVNRSTIKRWRGKYGMREWPSSKNRNKATEKKNMIVKAAYGDINVRVSNFDSSKQFEWLSKELGVKLKLQVGSFRIEYEDDSGNRIPITCTEHLMSRLDSLFSSNMKNMYLIITRSN